MSAVNVGVHCGEPVGERFGDEALRGEVVTLVKSILAENVEDRRIAFEACRMQSKTVEQMFDPAEATRRVFQRHASYNSVHLITKSKKMLRQIAAILSGDAGY